MPETVYPASLDEAMAKFQADLPSILKDEKATVRSDKGSYSYGYAGLDAISEAVLRRLGALGVSWRTRPTLDDGGKFALHYRLRHVSGEEEVGTWPLSVGTPQQMGSAITYARRYALMAVTGVFPEKEDDDGAAASQQRSRDANASNGGTPEDWDAATPARQPATQQPSAAQVAAFDELAKRVAGAESVDAARALWNTVNAAVTAEKVTAVQGNALRQAINERVNEFQAENAPAPSLATAMVDASANAGQPTDEAPEDPEAQPLDTSADAPMRNWQKAKMYALFAETGRKDDRDAQLGVMLAVTQRERTTRDDLTYSEAQKVIAVLSSQVRNGAGREAVAAR